MTPIRNNIHNLYTPEESSGSPPSSLRPKDSIHDVVWTDISLNPILRIPGSWFSDSSSSHSGLPEPSFSKASKAPRKTRLVTNPISNGSSTIFIDLTEPETTSKKPLPVQYSKTNFESIKDKMMIDLTDGHTTESEEMAVKVPGFKEFSSMTSPIQQQVNDQEFLKTPSVDVKRPLTLSFQKNSLKRKLSEKDSDLEAPSSFSSLPNYLDPENSSIDMLSSNFKKAYSYFPQKETEEVLRKVILASIDRSIKKINPKKIKGFKSYLKKMEESGIPDKIQVVKISEEIGWGVFAKKNIEAKEFLGIYSGLFELVQADNLENNEYVFDLLEGFSKEELITLNLKDNGNGEYFLRTNAKEVGNFTRYINHSSSPNVKPKLQIIDGDVQVLLFASEPVQEGRQLFLDYGEEYWKKLGIKPKDLKHDTYIFGKPPQDEKKEKRAKVVENKLKWQLIRSQDPDKVLNCIVTSLKVNAAQARTKFKARFPDKKMKESIREYDQSLSKGKMPFNLSLECRDSGEPEVFLEEDSYSLPPGTLIGVWSGEYRIIKDSEKKEYDYSYAFDLHSFVRRKESYHLLVDAKDKGNYTKYIQRSSEPNVEPHRYLMPDGKLEMMILTTREIQPGEALYMDFGGHVE